MSLKSTLFKSSIIVLSIIFIWLGIRAYLLYFNHSWGDKIDSLDGVSVYYNGGIDYSNGRTVIDGYNVGLKYQCVEFVKRYYLKHYNHKMPDSYGHAKDYFQLGLEDGGFNKARGLIQYTNPSKTKPQKGDLIVMGAGKEKYGHVAIVSEVSDDFIEIIQQNAGIVGRSRKKYDLSFEDNQYHIENKRINGWLRKK